MRASVLLGAVPDEGRGMTCNAGPAQPLMVMTPASTASVVTVILRILRLILGLLLVLFAERPACAARCPLRAPSRHHAGHSAILLGVRCV